MPSLLLLLLGRFNRVRLCATPYRAAHQAPPSLGFSRQEHWSGLPFPCPVHASEKWKWSRSVVSDSLRPHGLQPTRLLRPWDFPGKSTGVGCHCLLRMPSIHSHKRKTYCSPPVCFSFTFTLLSHLTELHSNTSGHQICGAFHPQQSVLGSTSWASCSFTHLWHYLPGNDKLWRGEVERGFGVDILNDKITITKVVSTVLDSAFVPPDTALSPLHLAICAGSWP